MSHFAQHINDIKTSLLGLWAGGHVIGDRMNTVYTKAEKAIDQLSIAWQEEQRKMEAETGPSLFDGIPKE